MPTETNGSPSETQNPAPTRSQQSLMLEILAMGAAQIAAGNVTDHDQVLAELEAEDRPLA